jgi:hypothetical protein
MHAQARQIFRLDQRLMTGAVAQSIVWNSKTDPFQFSFDTYRMVVFLEGRGFSRSQAVCIMRILNEMLYNAIRKCQTEMITKKDQESVRLFFLIC